MAKYFEAALVLDTERLGGRILIDGDRATNFATQPAKTLDHRRVPTIGSKI